METIKKIFFKLFSTSMAGLYMILFAIAIGVATFIENDFGTSAAQKVVFKTRWFELLLLLFSISILVNIFRYRLIQQKKWATFAFHASMLVILFGAAVTRYTGFEGMMHIREGSYSNSFLSADEYLVFNAATQQQDFSFDEPVLFASLGNNNFKESYSLGGNEVEVEVLEFIPNPKEKIQNEDNGKPVINIVIGGANGREEYFLEYGQRSRIRGTLFNFGNDIVQEAFNIKYENDSLLFMANREYSQMVMATQEQNIKTPNEYHPLMLRSLYSDGERSFVFGNFKEKGKRVIVADNVKMASNSKAALKIRATNGGHSIERYIIGMKGVEGRSKIFQFEDLKLAISYGSKPIQLPFSLELRDFILEKYPGTDNASSYASEVTLVDDRKNIRRNDRIYMNNILNYGGYRFFQSSFDQDELGTYLSVNHDFWGTLFSYMGYGILTIGMLLTFFDKKSRFRYLAKKLSDARKAAAVGLMLVLGSMIPQLVSAKTPVAPRTIDKVHAEQFGKVIMQDHRGRMKPMNTYCSEILRKLSRKTSINGQSPEQVILGMTTNPREWYSVPMIKIGKHQHTRELIPIEGDLAAYNDFFDLEGKYKLQEYIRDAYNTPKKDRGVFEKDMLKLDEKINICSMVFNGSFFRSFPIYNDKNNLWDAPRKPSPSSGETYSWNFYSTYIPSLQKALVNNNWSTPNQLLEELDRYQVKYGSSVIPSSTKIKAELLLNESRIFGRLTAFYGILAFVFLSLLFINVFKPKTNVKWPTKIALSLFGLSVVLHLLGLALRWYVSGRAPWSNGYESMIYIGFTTVLAGSMFSRKSLGGLAATCTLAASIMLVAGLSWLDPEITPLVPVLKSYWLTIHVSLIAGSYGFLMLGAIIGVLNLVFMILRTQKNKENVNRIIKELGYISEMTLMGGLFMISVGTYLGGVWANESWGRYWGWDAKETWALVTILVYAFILHMRFIPGLRGAFAFNVATLFGWASVIMTYFGVNYYLSGLHSYAAGDPVPIPSFVYYAVAILTVLSVIAYWRDRAYRKSKRVT